MSFALTMNTSFTPLSFDEAIKPFLMYRDAYEKAEEQYTQLLHDAGVWEKKANKENSPEAWAMYRQYMNDLQYYATDFGKGLNLKNRRGLMTMKGRYAKEIKPVEDAYNTMVEANRFRDEKGYDAVFKVDRYNSIDNFLHGETANNSYVSRDAIIKEYGARAERLMAAVMRDPEFKSVMGGQQWQILQKSGASPEELFEAIKVAVAGNPIASNKLSELRQQFFKDIKIENYDAVGQQKLVSAIDTAIHYGLNKPTYQFIKDEGYTSPFQKAQMNKMAQETAQGWAQIDIARDRLNHDIARDNANSDGSGGQGPGTGKDGTGNQTGGFATLILDNFNRKSNSSSVTYRIKRESPFDSTKFYLYNDQTKWGVVRKMFPGISDNQNKAIQTMINQYVSPNLNYGDMKNTAIRVGVVGNTIKVHFGNSEYGYQPKNKQN